MTLSTLYLGELWYYSILRSCRIFSINSITVSELCTVFGSCLLPGKCLSCGLLSLESKRSYLLDQRPLVFLSWPLFCVPWNPRTVRDVCNTGKSLGKPGRAFRVTCIYLSTKAVQDPLKQTTFGLLLGKVKLSYQNMARHDVYRDIQNIVNDSAPLQ